MRLTRILLVFQILLMTKVCHSEMQCSNNECRWVEKPIINGPSVADFIGFHLGMAFNLGDKDNSHGFTIGFHNLFYFGIHRPDKFAYFGLGLDYRRDSDLDRNLICVFSKIYFPYYVGLEVGPIQEMGDKIWGTGIRFGITGEVLTAPFTIAFDWFPLIYPYIRYNLLFESDRQHAVEWGFFISFPLAKFSRSGDIFMRPPIL